ncbi:hypothetical protein [Mesorhizobium sp. M0207]|uniref:hypothetical protein n=1 Tax=Mesorhizobium sp. M0207 TaxID=2956915 RepID=UPI0033370CDB
MSEHLFHKVSWHQVATVRARQAVQIINQMSRADILDPNIAKTLDGLAAKQVLVVPELVVSAIDGARREESREDSDGWGGRFMRSVAFMDVTIPFRGDEDGFRVTPSHSPLGLRAEIRHDSLLLTLPDDGQVQAGVDRFVERVSGALDSLRKEVEAWQPQFRQAVQSAFQTRREEIEEQSKRDGALKFPVR